MKRAFTLIELLVALVIFSFALIISAGVFSNIIGNQSLVAVNSEANREAGRITRQISDDVVSSTVEDRLVNIRNVKGILLFNEGGTIIRPPATCLNVATATLVCYPPIMAVFFKDGYKIYRINTAAKTIEYATGSGTFPAAGNTGLDLLQVTFKKLNSDKVEVISPGFRGIVCFDVAPCNQQPIVFLDLTVQTKDYSTKAVKRRASLQLKTTVTARSY